MCCRDKILKLRTSLRKEIYLTVPGSESTATTPFCCEPRGRCHHSDGNIGRKANVMITEATETNQSGRACFITAHLLKTGLLHGTSMNPFPEQCHYSQATICHLWNVYLLCQQTATPQGPNLEHSILWGINPSHHLKCAVSPYWWTVTEWEYGDHSLKWSDAWRRLGLLPECLSKPLPPEVQLYTIPLLSEPLLCWRAGMIILPTIPGPSECWDDPGAASFCTSNLYRQVLMNTALCGVWSWKQVYTQVLDMGDLLSTYLLLAYHKTKMHDATSNQDSMKRTILSLMGPSLHLGGHFSMKH